MMIMNVDYRLQLMAIITFASLSAYIYETCPHTRYIPCLLGIEKMASFISLPLHPCPSIAVAPGTSTCIQLQHRNAGRFRGGKRASSNGLIL